MKHDFLEFENYYHIYNRANGSEKLFLTRENYRYFISKYIQYIVPIADTYCYCLMPNHFHFLVKIKTRKEVVRHYELVYGKETINSKQNDEAFERAILMFLSQQLSNLFNGYTQAFNKMFSRKGSLFMRPFKRKIVDSSIYFYNLVYYIHHNPTQAGLSKTPNEWEYSSFAILISDSPSFLYKIGLMDWFESKEQFINFHAVNSISIEKNFEPKFD